MSFFGTSFDDPKTAAILGLAGGLLQGNAGAGLQQGLLGAQRQSQINSYNQRQSAADARETELFGLKKSEYERETKAAEQKAFNEQRVREILPMLAAGKIGAADAIAAGVPNDLVKAIKESGTYGRPKGTRQVEVDDGQGGKRIDLVSDYGDKVASFNGYVAPVQVNTGSSIMFAKPTAGQSFAVGMSPSERDASARGWASNRIAQQRLEMDKSQGQYQFNAELGGYVPKAPGGQFVPLAGGEKAVKPPTEGQGKALLFGSRMAAANKIFDDLEAKGYTTPSYFKAGAESVPVIGGALGNLANITPFVSAQEQQLEQGQRDFINAVLRRESGAVISPEEFENAKRQYFPQFGDSKEVTAQKKKNRELATRGILYEAGPHASKLNQPTPAGKDLLTAADAILNGGR